MIVPAARPCLGQAAGFTRHTPGYFLAEIASLAAAATSAAVIFMQICSSGVVATSPKRSCMPIRRSGAAQPPSANTSATAEPSPPIMEWFSAVTIAPVSADLVLQLQTYPRHGLRCLLPSAFSRLPCRSSTSGCPPQSVSHPYLQPLHWPCRSRT